MKRVTFLSPIVAFLFSALFVASPLAMATVSAQTIGSSLPGITVLGVGQASVPAETATIVIMLGSGDYYKDPMMAEEAGASTPAASPEETAAPVISALVGAGVPETDIELLQNPFTGDYGPYGGPVQVTLRFTLAAPTSEGISGILMAAITAATDAGLFVNMTSALYGVADCAALEREARDAAISHARDQASVQAELLDVSLGDVVASRDNAYGAVMFGGTYGGILQYNTCTLGQDLESISSAYSAPAFDPSMEPTVVISAYIELTFEIAPGA